MHFEQVIARVATSFEATLAPAGVVDAVEELGQPRPWPRGAGSAADVASAPPYRVSARIQSRNARASGFSPDPGAIARK